MPRFEWLQKYVEPILKKHRDHHWLCYQILERLRETSFQALQRLDSRYDTGYGRGGGPPNRPDNAISQCLADWPECVDVRYLHGKGLSIGDIEGSAERFGIFRWICD